MDDLLASGRRLRVPDVALIETILVLESHYRFTRSEVARAIRLILGQSILVLDRVMWIDVIDAYEEHPKLSVTDVYLVIESQRRGDGPVYSFDAKLVSQMNAVRP